MPESDPPLTPQQPQNMLFNMHVRLLALETAHAKLHAKHNAYVKRVGL
jgi:hypothetical protein